MKNLFKILFIFLLVFSFSSCSKDDKLFDYHYMAVKLSGSKMWSILDIETGKIVYEDEFKHEPSVINDGVFYVEDEDGLYNYYDVDDVKKPINETPYYSVTPMINNRAIVSLPGKQLSIIDESCKEQKLLDKSIQSALGFIGGLSIIQNTNGKYGVMDDDGDIKVKMKYDNISLSYDGKYMLTEIDANNDTKKFALKTLDEKILFEFTNKDYSSHNMMMNDLLPVVKDKKIIFLDKNGKKAFSLGKVKEDMDLPFNIGLYNDDNLIFVDNDLYGIADGKGNVKVRAKYDDLNYIGNGNFKAKKQEKCGIINSNDDVILNFDEVDLTVFGDDRIMKKEGKTYSLMNLKGEDIGTENFDEISIGYISSANSNYFDANGAADKYAKFITSESFYNKTKTYSVRDYSVDHYISEYGSLDEYSDKAYEDEGEFVYTFRGPISSSRYEYFYGYRFSNGVGINYSTKIFSILTSYDVNDYAITSEAAFTKCLENKLQAKGFKIQDGVLVSSTGNSVSIGYKDGSINILYGYDHTVSPLVRTERKEIRRRSFDDYDSTADTVAIDTVAVDTCLY